MYHFPGKSLKITIIHICCLFDARPNWLPFFMLPGIFGKKSLPNILTLGPSERSPDITIYNSASVCSIQTSNHKLTSQKLITNHHQPPQKKSMGLACLIHPFARKINHM